MVIGIETDRGLWVQALVAAGYTVLAVNPLQAARYRERLSVSGAKSDAADAPMPADMVRTDSHQLRPVAGHSPEAAAIQAALRTEHLGRPAAVTAAYAATIGSAVAVLTMLGEQIKALQGQGEDRFGRHPAAEIILSQPGLGPVPGAREPAEFGDPEGREKGWRLNMSIVQRSVSPFIAVSSALSNAGATAVGRGGG
ncbi:transposase [Streptosporangium brasiliense]|uniref:Transposase n=1 Tax=Streptosporangium brasiliense TaxID=47480 RepID=A0ABT9RGM5_9ACTN|nr:transposase [Streptosporangium brasiliense]